MIPSFSSWANYAYKRSTLVAYNLTEVTSLSTWWDDFPMLYTFLCDYLKNGKFSTLNSAYNRPILSTNRSLPLYTTTERREDTLVLVTDVLANTERILEVEVMLVDSITTEFCSTSITLVTSERFVFVVN